MAGEEDWVAVQEMEAEILELGRRRLGFWRRRGSDGAAMGGCSRRKKKGEFGGFQIFLRDHISMYCIWRIVFKDKYT